MPYWSSGDMTNQKINTKLGDLLGWVGGKVENEGQRETNFQPNYGPKWNWVIFIFHLKYLYQASIKWFSFQPNSPIVLTVDSQRVNEKQKTAFETCNTANAWSVSKD